jgi:transcriptional regulator with XRE-family HTH domain
MFIDLFTTLEGCAMASALAVRLNTIRDRGGMKSREVAQLLDTTPQTVSRWQTGKVEPQPDRLQRLLNLDWLVSELSELYEPDEARLWLFSPHRLLDGKRPADRIQKGQVEDVLALISQLRDGAFV